MKDKTSIKYFDKFYKKFFTQKWWQTKCVRCNRNRPIDTFIQLDKSQAKKLHLSEGYSVNLCAECRKELGIRRFFDNICDKCGKDFTRKRGLKTADGQWCAKHAPIPNTQIRST